MAEELNKRLTIEIEADAATLFMLPVAITSFLNSGAQIFGEMYLSKEAQDKLIELAQQIVNKYFENASKRRSERTEEEQLAVQEKILSHIFSEMTNDEIMESPLIMSYLQEIGEEIGVSMDDFVGESDDDDEVEMESIKK